MAARTWIGVTPTPAKISGASPRVIAVKASARVVDTDVLVTDRLGLRKRELNAILGARGERQLLAVGTSAAAVAPGPTVAKGRAGRAV